MAKNKKILDSPEKVIKERRNAIRDKKAVISFLQRLILLGGFMWVLLGVLFGMTTMNDDTMKPRLSAGDILFYYRLGDVHIGDIVVINKDDKKYVARVIAQGGDEVEITNDRTVKINGSIVIESDVYYQTPQYEDGIEFPIKLKENEYFLLADYREGAKDSRSYGPVTREEIKGMVITVIRRSGL